jgi:hypothetical protein
MAFGFKVPNIVKRILQTGDKGGFFFETFSADPSYDKTQRLIAILENPAALFIFILLPDLASMAKFKLYEEGEEEEGKEIEQHKILDLLKSPNPMQTQKQFIWDYMFWRLLGCASLLSDSKVLKRDAGNIIYWLSPDCIDWPKWFRDNAQTLFFSEAAITELQEKDIKYKTPNQTLPFKYKQLKQFSDISNGIKSWFEPPSRVDALYKIIENSDKVLNSKNVTSQLAGKFVVSGKHAATDTSTLPMGHKETADIERKVLSNKSIHGMKSMIDIKRFINDLGEIEKLDKAFMNDAFFIGKMLGIPKDVIESFEQGATYENQEKARALTISYCIQAAMDDACVGILDFYGIKGYVLKATYDHLPFVQVFEKTRAETADKKASAFKKLVEGGADQEESANYLNLPITKFTEPKALGGATTENPEERSDND